MKEGVLRVTIDRIASIQLICACTFELRSTMGGGETRVRISHSCVCAACGTPISLSLDDGTMR